LTDALGELGAREVETASNLAEAMSKLRAAHDLLLVDVHLTDGKPRVLLEMARHLASAPRVVVVAGRSGAVELVELILAGADGYVERPLRPERVRACLESVAHGENALRSIIRAQVGRVNAKKLVHEVRTTMHHQALNLVDGNKKAAARLLGINRRCLQRNPQHQSPRVASEPGEHLTSATRVSSAPRTSQIRVVESVSPGLKQAGVSASERDRLALAARIDERRVSNSRDPFR
jgi:DNA-binding NtrC family response regulator